MNHKDFIKKIITAANKQPMPVKMPKNDSISTKREEPWKAATGPEAFLATRNQPSGAHVPLKNKEKSKQDIKKKLRTNYEDF